jgi:hypothetical protein
MSNSTLAAIIQVLDQAGIDHMVAGSFASGYHGAMRTTHDIDLIVDTELGEGFDDGADVVDGGAGVYEAEPQDRFAMPCCGHGKGQAGK